MLDYYGDTGVRPTDREFAGCVGRMQEDILYMLVNVRATKGFKCGLPLCPSIMSCLYHMCPEHALALIGTLD